MKPGVLGEPMREQEPLLDQHKKERPVRYLLWHGSLRVQCPKTCQRPESMLLCRSGLFRPLRSPAYERTLVERRGIWWVFFWS